MNKMIYNPPEAEIVIFAPDHPLAASNDNSAWWSFWNWGKHGQGSVQGTKNIWTDENWIYSGSSQKNDKPY